MTILTEGSLEFARAHISKYYDSDFFPKPIEFEALWHCWDEVKGELTSKNIAKLWVLQPRTMPAVKPDGTYRIVHQLEPLDAIVYTACAYLVGEDIEAARMPEKERVACSYRLNIDGGSLFSSGSGYRDFTEKTEELALQFRYVLTTDITDFFNQIYIHRVENAIESANIKLKPLGGDIENFLMRLNGKVSQGVPVGPAASIVMAEAIFIDIDQFIKSQDVTHTRYVDDLRIFGNSERQLRNVLQGLTSYLYSHHRLTLSANKTELHESPVFIAEQLHNPFAEERDDLLARLQSFNPYSEEYEEVELDEDESRDLLKERLVDTVDEFLRFNSLDLALARSTIRLGKGNRIAELIDPLTDNIDFFAPVVNDLVLYLLEVTDEAVAERLVPRLIKISESELMDNLLVRFWFERYLVSFQALVSDEHLRTFVFDGPNVENQARAAVMLKDILWVREKKNGIYNLGAWERRSVLYATQVLPGEERKVWLNMTIGGTPFVIDKWVARWMLDTS